MITYLLGGGKLRKGDSLIIVDGSVCFVQSICASSATVVSQTRSDGYPSSCKQHRFCGNTVDGGPMSARQDRSREKSGQGMSGTCRSIGKPRDDCRRRQGPLWFRGQSCLFEG